MSILSALQTLRDAVDVTPEARAYIERTHLTKLSSKFQNAMGDAVVNLYASFGFTSPENTLRANERAAAAEAQHNQEVAHARGGVDALLVIPAKYRETPYHYGYWPVYGNAIMSYAAELEHGVPSYGLYVHGASHTGKSHGMAIIAMAALKCGRSVEWLSCPRLRNLLEDAIKQDDIKQLALDVKRRALAASILVLDDIGKDATGTGDRRTPSYFVRTLHEIIDARQDLDKRATLYTSEFDVDDPALADRLMDSTVNRITDKSVIIGDSPRAKYKTWAMYQDGNALPGMEV